MKEIADTMEAAEKYAVRYVEVPPMEEKMKTDDVEQAEYALLCCMLKDNNVFRKYAFLPSKYFCSDTSEIVFEAIKEIIAKGEQADEDAVGKQLLDNGEEIFVDFDEVKNVVPTAANADYYALNVIKNMFESMTAVA